MIPAVNNIIGDVTGSSISFNIFENRSILLMIFGVAILTGILSGLYPSLFLSSFQPALILKGTNRSKNSKAAFRNVLVIVQFVISIILIIGTGVIHKQLNYIKSKDIGYAKDQLITISLKGDSRKAYDIFKDRLNADSRILGVTGMADDLPDFWSTSSTAERPLASGVTICWPMVYLDRHLIRNGGFDMPATLDEILSGFDLSAVEVYRTPAEVPPTFNGPNAGCGVIVLWTRRGGSGG